MKFARATAEAAWAAGSELYNREHFAIGLAPHRVKEAFYFARGPADTNLFLDTTDVMTAKLAAVHGHKTMMRATALHLKDKLGVAGLRLPLLDREDQASIEKLIDILYRESGEARGKRHGVKYAEEFHHATIE